MTIPSQNCTACKNYYIEVHKTEDLVEVAALVKECGKPVSPRGKGTIEIRNVVVRVDPDVSMEPLITNMAFADKRVKYIMHKMHFELNEIKKLLHSEPATRRARMIEPDYHPNNIACVQIMQFFRRDGCLEVTAFLRSSDTINVLPLDIYAFQRLQADVLGGEKGVSRKKPGDMSFNMDKGPITIHIASAHIYIED